jgi:hypothetical protein
MVAAGGFGASTVFTFTHHWTRHTGFDWRAPTIMLGVAAAILFVVAIVNDDLETLRIELGEKQRKASEVEARVARLQAYREARR